MKKLIQPRFVFLASVLLLLAACKLDKPILPSHADTTGKGHVDTTGSGGTNPAPADTYMPVTKGTHWTYASSGGVVDTSTITLTGNTAVFNTLTYYEATSTSKLTTALQTGYLYAANHVYRQRQTVAGNTLDLYELNDTTQKGHSWIAPLNETGLVNGVPGQLIGTIVEKGVTKTVNNKVYNNVMEVELEIQYDYGLGNGYETSQVTEIYFAQGIGPIETDTAIPGLGTSVSILIDYVIK